MKKNYFKKSLSLVLTVLMLMSCWVFVAPTETEAVDAGASVAATNRALLDQINTNAPDTSASTTYYQYKIYGNGDVNSGYNTEANRNEYFKKILSVSTQTVTDINMGSYFTGVPNTDQNVSVVYPSMVLRYDGSGDKPRFGLLFQGDANSGNKMGFQYAKLTSNTSEFTFNPGYWKGIAANDSCFFYIMKGASEGAYMSAQTTTSGAAFNSRSNGQWEFVATTLEYGGTLSSSEWVKAYKLGWEFHNRSTTFQGTTTSTIYVMNFKAYTDFITQTIYNKKAIVYNNAGEYTTESIRNFVNAANNFINYNPKNYTSVTNAPTWGTQIASYASAFNTAANNLTKRNVNVTYENLFSINDWAQSASSVAVGNGTTGEVIFENNDTVRIYKNGAGNEVTTSSSYSGNHKDTMYSMPVTGGKDYTVRFNITSSVDGAPTSEVFLFWYDANNNPVVGTNNGSNTFNNKRFSSNGLCSVTFTAPANAAKAEIRFDNDSATAGSTIWFNDIAVYPAERNTAVGVDSWTTRPVTKTVTSGTTLSGKLDVPARTNYEFEGWYIDSNKNGLLDSGETQLTDAAGNVIANNVTISESTNLVSEWRSLPLDIGYDNLFSLAEWAKTDSNSVNSNATALNVDIMNGTIAVTGKSDAYTIYGGGNTNYTVPVTAGEEYIFTYDVTSTNDTYQAFVFFYNDAGEGVTSTVQNAPHIGVYNGAPITFTVPEGCTKVGFRVGICGTAEGTATYSNIGLYKKSVYDAYAKDYAVIRVPFYVGDTTALTLNPTRAGYTFTGWVDSEGNTITSVAGLEASDTVYATWVQQLTVQFKNYDGTVIKTQSVTPGTAATAPAAPPRDADENYEYEFTGWDKDFSNVTEDLVVTAQFSSKEHGNITYTNVSLADCVNPGTIRKTCDDCGYAWNNGAAFPDVNGESVPALGHNYETVVTKSSTGIDGVHTVACNRANCKYGADGGPATITAKHNFIEDENHPASTATCVTPGETYYLCACLETKTITGEIDPNNHDNTEIRDAKDAKCEVAGYTGDTWCADCNTKLETGTVIKALEHSYTTYTSNGDATCTADGTKTAKCDNGCGEEDTITDTGSQISHKYTNYVSNGDAKCGVDGTKTAKCDYNCNVGVDTVTDVGSALKHNFSGDYVTNNNGTHVQKCVNNDCTATGNEKACEYGAWTKDDAATHSHTCTKCNYTPAAEAHDWSAWTTVGGSATEKATQTRSCTVCGRTESSECNYVVADHKNATCEAAELTTYKCSDCGHGYTVIGEGPKGHNFNGTAKNNNNGTHSFACANGCGEYGFGTTKNASVACSDWTYTNTEAGKHTATCNTCGYVKTEDCSGGEATCTAQAECQFCNIAYGDKAAHNITGTEKYLKKATDATCIANETYYKYCINCESEFSTETYEKPDTKTPHDYICTDEYLYIATQAKCGVNETYYAYCSNPDCKKSSEDATNTFEKPNTALTHKWGNAVNNNNGTHTEKCLNSNTDGWTCAETRDVNCVEWEKQAGVASPTCTEQGYTLYECDVCAYTWKDDYTDALGHDYTEKIYDAAHLKDAANCEHANIYYYDCSRCDKNAKDIADGEVYTGQATYSNGEVRMHVWQNKVEDRYLAAEATCNTAAWYYSSCSYEDCAKSSKEIYGDATTRKFQSGSGLGHNWVKPDQNSEDFIKYRATEGDCVTNETYYYVCSRADVCKVESSKGSGKNDGETWELENSKSGHELTHTPAKAADCYNAGNYEYWYCANCKKYFKDADATEVFANETATKISKRSHDKVSVAYKAATCEVDGNPDYEYCKYDDCEYTTLPADISGYKAKGHNFTGAYTYDTVMLYHSKLCINGCGDSGIVVDGVQVEYKVEYNEDDVAVITGGEKCEFTYKAETKNGVHSHANACVCGNNTTKTYSDEETFVETVAPTCTTKGYDSYACPDETCGATWTKNEKPANEHITAENATSNNDGTHSYYCTVDGCGYKLKTEKCSGGTATCSDKAVCSVCKGEYGEATGNHVLDETAWTQKTPADCYNAEVLAQTCSACNKEVTKEGEPATGHSMTEYGFDTTAWNYKPEDFDDALVFEPTCKDEGKSISYCVNCANYDLKTENQDKSKHVWATDDNGEKIWTLVSGSCSTGYTYMCKCTNNCGGAEIKTEPGVHEWVADTIVRDVCDKYDYIVFKCAKCGDFTTFDATTTDFELTDKDGNAIDIVSTYGLSTEKGQHSWSAYKVTKEATCAVIGRQERTCAKCDKVEKEDIPVIAGAHDRANYGKEGNNLKKIAATKATCTMPGHHEDTDEVVYYYECTRCSYSENANGKYTQPALDHKDNDGDGICDNGCKDSMESINSKADGCICHKDSGFMKFIYSILKFFWKLFKINPVCACGKAHY